MSSSDDEEFLSSVQAVIGCLKDRARISDIQGHIRVPFFQYLCDKVSALFRGDSNVVRTRGRTVVVGDIHGQIQDLIEIFAQTIDLPDTRFVFLGDYVDRGDASLEVVMILFSLKVRYPERFIILRGNHESRGMTEAHGFKKECEARASLETYNLLCDTFNTLPLVAIIDDAVFCVHGGISKSISSLSDINALDRFCEVPSAGPMMDLLWSDPNDEVEEFKRSRRGNTFLFGLKPVEKFLAENNLSLIVRAHEVCFDGYEYPFDTNNFLTIFSASNYSTCLANEGAYLIYDKKVNIVVLPRHASAANSDYEDLDSD